MVEGVGNSTDACGDANATLQISGVATLRADRRDVRGAGCAVAVERGAKDGTRGTTKARWTCARKPAFLLRAAATVLAWRSDAKLDSGGTGGAEVGRGTGAGEDIDARGTHAIVQTGIGRAGVDDGLACGTGEARRTGARKCIDSIDTGRSIQTRR